MQAPTANRETSPLQVGASTTSTIKLSELTGDYVIDAARTRIGFVAQLGIVIKVRGQFDEFAGSAHLDGDHPSKSSAQITIQTRSIQTRNDLRDKHLRKHFLDVSNHPVIRFASIRVQQVDETNFKVIGELNIRGVTRPVTVDFELIGAENDPSGKLRVDFGGNATINRNDWGVSWNAVVEGGGVFVSERVALDLYVSAIRES